MFLKRLLVLVFTISAIPLTAQVIERQLDKLIQRTLTSFDTPSISVGFIKNKKAVYTKGYGINSLINKKPINNNTFFGITPNSKEVTCFALAIMINKKVCETMKYPPHIPYISFDFHDLELLKTD